MKTTKSRSCSIVAMIMSILLAVSFGAAGCAQKVVPAEGPQISMMEKTNVTSSGDPHNAPSTQYDAVPFTWNVVQNTLQSSGIAVLHVNDVDNWGGMLLWCSGSPLLAVQQWSYRDRLPCVTATSKDLTLLALPMGMQYAPLTSESIAHWYVPEEKAFVATPSELLVSVSRKTLNGVTMIIVEHALASGSKEQTLAVPVPSGMWQIAIVYGSGSIRDGFVLVEASEANAPINTLVPSHERWESNMDTVW